MSDKGTWFTGRIVYHGREMTGLADVEAVRLVDATGRVGHTAWCRPSPRPRELGTNHLVGLFSKVLVANRGGGSSASRDRGRTWAVERSL